MAVLVDLMESAIDSAGAQLARSEGLRFDRTDDSEVLWPKNRRSSRSPVHGASADDADKEIEMGIEAT